MKSKPSFIKPPPQSISVLQTDFYIVAFFYPVFQDFLSHQVSTCFAYNAQKEALDFILENAYEPGFGARPLKRYMQKHVETLVAKEILEDRVKEGDNIEIRLQDGKLAAAVV